jgi:anthranilate 1,2-dioxygenase small subunit/terephthalate 1,2-dioxygenase oxygenase component beta subunit
MRKDIVNILSLAAFNAAYADAIDSDALEKWPSFFTAECHYRITTRDNEHEGLQAGIVYADSRAMLEDRVSALRKANVYERQTYRHLIGLPILDSTERDSCVARSPFLVARVMASGQTMVFATGEYRDRFVQAGTGLLLASRVAVCDSVATDTLLALPL